MGAVSAWADAFGVAWGQSWGGGSAPVLPDTHDGFNRKRKDEWREKQESLAQTIRQAVERVTAPIAQEIRQQHPSESRGVDYEALERDTERVERLLEAYQAELDDEFAFIVHFFI